MLLLPSDMNHDGSSHSLSMTLSSKGDNSRTSKTKTLNEGSEIKLIFDQTRSFLERVDFIDAVTGDLINQFDLVVNNPYNNLAYPEKGKTQEGNKVYDLSNFQLEKEQISFFITSQAMKSLEHSKVTYCQSNSTFYKAGNKFIVIVYNLMAIGQNGGIVGFRSSAFILDNEGKVVKKFEHLDVGIFQHVLTNDGRFFAFRYGGVLNESGYQQFPESIRGYDIKSGELIFEECSVKNESFSSPVIVKGGNKIRISSMIYSTDNRRPNFKIRIIDFENKICYSKMYSAGKRDLLKQVTNEALIFRNSDKSESIESYETHFIKKNF